MVNKKLLITLLVGVMAVAVVSALSYYALATVTLNVNQPISIDGDGPQSVDCDAGDTCLGSAIRVSNSDDEDRVVTITDNSGDNIVTSYVGILELTKKDSNWVPLTDKTELTYTVVGETFEFSGVPEGYTLIYYKDKVVGLDERLDNPQPAITVTSDIGSFPHIDDANIDALADYCATPDFYEHCKGAKLWVVPNGDLADENLNWANMFDGYYYETDLVYYFANSEGEITVPAKSFIEFYPQFEVNQHTNGGQRTIQITVA